MRRSHKSHFKTTPKWPAQVVRHADHTNHLFKTPLKWPAQVVLHADHTNNISKQRQNDLHRWYDTQISRITFQNTAKMTCTGGTQIAKRFKRGRSQPRTGLRRKRTSTAGPFRLSRPCLDVRGPCLTSSAVIGGSKATHHVHPSTHPSRHVQLSVYIFTKE